MSISNSVIDAMLAAGCTAEQLAAAVKAANDDAENSKAAKREDDRRRKQKSRSRLKRSHDVTVTGVTPPNDIYSNPPDSSPSEANASSSPKKKGVKSSRLPVDWQPEPLTAEIETMISAWPVGMLERQLSKFRDYWAGASGRRAEKRDWNAALRYWLKNADEWKLGNGTADRTSASNTQPVDGFTGVLRDVGSREAAGGTAYNKS